MRHMLIIFILSQLLLAAPAYSGKRTFTQPDGTVVTYRMQGDEHLHWLESKEGDILLKSEKNRRLEYAAIKEGKLKASGIAFSKKSVPLKRVSKNELRELHAIKQNKRLSKMKSRHKAH